MPTITFDGEPDVARHLEQLSQFTNADIGELINILLASPLRQIIEQPNREFNLGKLDGRVDFLTVTRKL
jgi:hypothetical protein